MTLCAVAKRPVTNEPVTEAVAADFVSAMARAVTGVSIVATDGPSGRSALTVSAVTSVSAEPPLLLVCVNRRNPLRAAILGNGVFSVSLLASDQSELADTFAGRNGAAPFDFSVAQWRVAENGVPLIESAAANFECALETAHESGTHSIIIGRVLGAYTSATEPLLYTMRNYGQPAPLANDRSDTIQLEIEKP